MPQYQELLFDDLPTKNGKPIEFKRVVCPVWTERKAKLIQQYLYYFVLITKHGTYIDGFAGPQSEDEDESWAAKLAIEFEPKRLRNFFLFDKNKKQYDCLIKLKECQKDDCNRNIDVQCGDFNKLVHNFLKENPIREKEATFCLLDQRTFECNWSTVKTLAEHKKAGYKIELFYFLPIGWLDRSLSALSDKKETLMRWWDREDWKCIESANAHKRSILFSERFKKELGYNYAHPWPIFEKRGGGRIMYYMIHATDHKEGPKLMFRAYTEVVKKISTEKQMTFDFDKTCNIEIDIPESAYEASE
jgi:three-Cys-motif partner protein